MRLAFSTKQQKKSWLSFLHNEIYISGPSVTVLVYEKEYPFSFISYFIRHHKQKLITIDLSDIQNNSTELFEQMLKSTFLGQTCVYVIKTSWEDLSHTQQKYLLHIINTYTGPHHCIIPVASNVISHFTHDSLIKIHVPDFLTTEEVLLFAHQSSFKSTTVFQDMVKHITQKSDHVSFNLVITLFDYASVLSNNIIDDFSKQMLPLLLNTKQSLYELSGHLFSKKQSFFQLWYLTEPTYSQAFWTTFWCDQLMKAALFCSYKKSGNAQEAQLIGTGLPFSFLNKDWRFYNSEGLSKGYTALYEYDCRIKDRILIKSLDSFFIMFFRHKFD